MGRNAPQIPVEIRRNHDGNLALRLLCPVAAPGTQYDPFSQKSGVRKDEGLEACLSTSMRVAGAKCSCVSGKAGEEGSRRLARSGRCCTNSASDLEFSLAPLLTYLFSASLPSGSSHHTDFSVLPRP